jgi:hypothetical protein
MTRRIRCVGSDNDYSYWDTPSWTRPNSNLTHSLMLNKRTLIVEVCSCERHQFNPAERLQDVRESPPSEGCKHKRKLAEIVQRRAAIAA